MIKNAKERRQALLVVWPQIEGESSYNCVILCQVGGQVA
jgi:hypothetical protein